MYVVYPAPPETIIVAPPEFPRYAPVPWGQDRRRVEGACYLAALSGMHEYRGVASRVGQAPEGIRFYEQLPGRATAHLATLPAPHPLDGGAHPRWQVRGRMHGLREEGSRAGDSRGREDSLLGGRRGVNGPPVL